MGKMRVGKGFGSELGGKIRDLGRKEWSELTRKRRLLVGGRVGRRRVVIVDAAAIDDGVVGDPVYKASSSIA
ncbi:hypothetical protein Hanom_Chr09g00859911 [Helianthus anomalus]